MTIYPTQTTLARIQATSEPDCQHPAPGPGHTGDRGINEDQGLHHQTDTKPSIIDDYADVLLALTPKRRLGLIAQLAVGFYEGWRPGRAEVIDLVAVELRMLSVDECERRRQYRNDGYLIPEINVLAAAHRLPVPVPAPPAAPPRRRDLRGQWATRNPPADGQAGTSAHQEGQSGWRRS